MRLTCKFSPIRCMDMYQNIKLEQVQRHGKPCLPLILSALYSQHYFLSSIIEVVPMFQMSWLSSVMVLDPPAQSWEGFHAVNRQCVSHGACPSCFLTNDTRHLSDTTISFISICHASHDISGNTMSHSFHRKAFCSFVLITEQGVKRKDC